MGETANPEKVILSPSRRRSSVLVVFFIEDRPGGAPSRSKKFGILKSPFVTVFERPGTCVRRGPLHFIILTRVISAANLQPFAAGRMIWSLAEDGMLPGRSSRREQLRFPRRRALVFSDGGRLVHARHVGTAAENGVRVPHGPLRVLGRRRGSGISIAHINFRRPSPQTPRSFRRALVLSGSDPRDRLRTPPASGSSSTSSSARVDLRDSVLPPLHVVVAACGP